MKTITTTVYTFDELDTRAKKKARDWFLTGLEFDGEYTIEDAETALAFAGFTVDRVLFTGFASQGDGACFEGAWEAGKVNAAGMREYAPQDADLHGIADECAALAAAFPGASLRVKHSGRYCHEGCTDFAVFITDAQGEEIDSPAAADAEKALIEVSRRAMRWIYRRLEAEYDAERETEAVDETIRANEYTFTADGKRFG
jgi:hypothetical protein